MRWVLLVHQEHKVHLVKGDHLVNVDRGENQELLALQEPGVNLELLELQVNKAICFTYY